MCQRAVDPARGKWDAPTGFLENGETLQEGAARETLEETGICIDASSLELYHVINMVAIEQVAVVFRVALSRIPELKPGPECLDVRFLSEDDIRNIQVAWSSQFPNWDQMLFSELHSGAFNIQLIDTAKDTQSTFRSRVYPIALRK